MSYYYAYTRKQIAMKDKYDNDSVSYHHLYSYMNQLVESNPNNYVMLQKDPVTPRFLRLFIAFGACTPGLTTVVLLFF